MASPPSPPAITPSLPSHYYLHLLPFYMPTARFAALPLLLLMAACSPADANLTDSRVLLRADFESLAGWGKFEAPPLTPSLTRERAHSGHYCIKTDKDLEYSLTYYNLLGRLRAQPTDKIKVSAWVFASQPGNAQLTVQLMRSVQDNTVIFSQAIDLGQVVKKPLEWTLVSQVFTLPTTLSTANELRIFVWRASASAPVYLDDLLVTNEP